MSADVDVINSLNPAVTDNPLRPVLDPRNIDVLEFVKKQIEDYYTPNTIDGIQYFDGIVYHVRDVSPSAYQKLEILGDFVKNVVGIQLREYGLDIPKVSVSEKPIAIYKIYIPKIHPYTSKFIPIPDQQQFGLGTIPEIYQDPVSRNFVRILPDVFHFTEAEEEARAKIGDIVRVSFTRERLFDYLYHGKISDEKVTSPSRTNSCRKKLKNKRVDPGGNSLGSKDESSNVNYLDCLSGKSREIYVAAKNQIANEKGQKCIPVVRESTSSPVSYKSSKTEVFLNPSIPHKENRVRLHSFGALEFNAPQVVNLPPAFKSVKRSIKVHRLVLPRLIALNEAWLADYPIGSEIITLTTPNEAGAKLTRGRSESIKLVSGLRRTEEIGARWLLTAPERQLLNRKKPLHGVLRARQAGETNIRNLFNQRLIDEYGSIQEGKRYLAWSSPHGTGLAIDFNCNGVASKKPNHRKMRETTFWKWLSQNAHLYGFTPLYIEAWHWECLVPRDNWFSGEEFTQDFSVRVSEKGNKTGTYTTSRQFYNKEIK